MLRQRTTTPVKDALNARGGDENGPNSASQEGSENSEVTTSTRSPNPFEVKEEKKAEPSVSKFRAAVFPIYGAEVKKFLLMGSIKFFVIMALTLTRDTKDTLVVTQCGAEAIAFLKVRLSRAMEIGVLADGENGTIIYGVLPAATGFIALYSKMSSSMGKKRLFFTTCIPFFVFFLLFDAVIYPNRDIIQPSVESVRALLGAKGGALEILSKIFSNWTSALYFVVAELYSSVSIPTIG
eukprot:scaffold1222_cov260-Chaetoceros_neogracile.AAC.2